MSVKHGNGCQWRRMSCPVVCLLPGCEWERLDAGLHSPDSRLPAKGSSALCYVNTCRESSQVLPSLGVTPLRARDMAVLRLGFQLWGQEKYNGEEKTLICHTVLRPGAVFRVGQSLYEDRKECTQLKFIDFNSSYKYIQCSILYYSAVQCSAVQCSAVQFSG